MKSTHTLFMAIPFDSATRAMYNRVRDHIRKEFPSIAVVIGKDEVGPSPEYSEIATFRAQNQQLNDQFEQQILRADVVLADLTHNNPNVHFELGLALAANKNILRVTGRSVTELGFDVRNLDVLQYADEAALIKRVSDYLRMFLRIKKLEIAPAHGELYRRVATPVHLRAHGPQLEAQLVRTAPATVEPLAFRDGAIRATFELLSTRSEADWFGVLFRAGRASPFLGSHMVHFRQSGAVELVLYPGPQILDVFPGVGPVSGSQKATIEFENDELSVEYRGEKLVSRALSNQAAGVLWLAAWQADADVLSAEMVARDTVEWRS